MNAWTSTDHPPMTQPVRISLRTKMIAGFALVLLLATIITAYSFFTRLGDQVLNEFQLRANSTARLVAYAQDGDALAAILAPGTEPYDRLMQVNLAIANANPEIRRLVLVRRDANGFYVVVDAAERDVAPYGERFISAGPLAQYYDTFTTAFADAQLTELSSGPAMSAYAPIFTSDGQRAGALVIILDASSVAQKQAQAATTSLVLLVIVILSGLLLSYVISSILANPLSKLSSIVRTSAPVQLRRPMQINTGDEVEMLATSFSAIARELHDVVQGLESRVVERSREASEATQQAERRIVQLETVSEVARTIATVRDLDQILPAITRVISQKFGYYHVGIFLVDDRREYAILRAANSIGGRKMLEREHKLRLEPSSIVGYAASLNAPRMALDVGADSVFATNADLPETRSELALPLVLSGQVIGVLDVQSIQADAFSQDDVNALNVLANQVATALENARLFSETRASLDEARKTSRELVGRDWSAFYRWLSRPGYKYDGANIKPLEEPLITSDVQDVAVQGEAMISPDGSREPRMVIPIKLRGEVIGILNVDANTAGRRWTREEVALAQAAAERASLALENARLVHEAQRRAAKERTIGEISGKLGSLIDIDNILQTAAQELGRTMPGAEVIIQFESNGKTKDA